MAAADAGDTAPSWSAAEETTGFFMVADDDVFGGMLRDGEDGEIVSESASLLDGDASLVDVVGSPIPLLLVVSPSEPSTSSKAIHTSANAPLPTISNKE